MVWMPQQLIVTLSSGEVHVHPRLDSDPALFFKADPTVGFVKWKRLVVCSSLQPSRLALGLQDRSVSCI